MPFVTHSAPNQRLHQIALARHAVLHDGKSISRTGTQAWIERSWQRCLDSGKAPHQNVIFDVIAPQALRRLEEANHALVDAARPVLHSLSQALASTRYFAILTDAQGIVIDAHGPIDRSDRRADLITRIGTDLSERQVATTAIGAALHELQPVWLHRGEHFFDANAVYSCAGAPLFGPDGGCIGMLDLTGIEAAERPELKHLVAQSARSIENTLTLGYLKDAGDLLIRLNWPGRTLGDESDGLVCVDTDGYILAANQAARLMVSQLVGPTASRLHCSDVFAIGFESLFDAARRSASDEALEVPLWTGLRLHALPVQMGHSTAPIPLRISTSAAPAQPLRDIETGLIRQAVDDARGNVMQAAKALGISRATVYRRLGKGIKKR